MDSDFSIELGSEDPVLDFPWSDPEGRSVYVDLKRHPESIAAIAEVGEFPELEEHLRAINSPRSSFESAKCDAWTTTELSAEEDIYQASHKCASYVDVVFSGDERYSFPGHERLSRELVALLRRAPEIPSAAECCVRRCHFDEQQGFYCTLYVSGYGKDEASARRNWGVGLRLVGNALLQLSSKPGKDG